MPSRNFILNNWGLKMAALGFATMIWLAVHSTLQKGISIPGETMRTDATRLFPSRPITVMTRAADRRWFRVIPDEVKVRVGGEIAVLKRLTDDDVQPFVKLTGEREPPGAFAVQIYLPAGVTLVELSPKAVHIDPGKQP